MPNATRSEQIVKLKYLKELRAGKTREKGHQQMAAEPPFGRADFLRFRGVELDFSRYAPNNLSSHC